MKVETEEGRCPYAVSLRLNQSTDSLTKARFPAQRNGQSAEFKRCVSLPSLSGGVRKSQRVSAFAPSRPAGRIAAFMRLTEAVPMLILYVLSLGPANWFLTKHCQDPRAIISFLYWPVFKVCESCDPLKEIAMRYLQTCHGLLDLWAMLP
jgi:hypothetical protein